MKYILTFFLTAIILVSFGQSKPAKAKTETDTLLNKFLKDMPEEARAGFLQEYNKMSPEQRKQMVELIDGFSSMPQSSKKQLVQNIDTNYAQIAALKDYFNKIVPPDYGIYIEFQPPSKILRQDESIDLWVFRKNNSNQYDAVFQEWNVELKSAKLDSLLRLTPLTRHNLQELKACLDKANCISISNRGVCEIGYARSGMGKYSYLVFDHPLNGEEKKQYNNGCTYIFYKDNIVLEYGGGAIVSQCFPDKE
jgi:succinate dehydrogenase flavin-adding protein (antitoxin of CptAB toxin-antitoxin module)